jgi:uncharacterized membrane protein
MSTEAIKHGITPAIQSRDMLRIISLLLVVVGIFISGYLTYVKLSQTDMVCVQGGAFNCSVVQNSVYSRFMGIEIAYLGLAMYLFVGALLLLEKRVAFLQEYGTALIFGVTLFAWLFSMWLVYVQFFLLQALCPWCLAHEVNITILFIVAILRLRRTLLA